MPRMSGPVPEKQFECLRPAPLDWVQFGFWLPPCLIHAVALAWVAVLAERHIAPWLLFPTFLGFVIGAFCVILVRFFQLGHRPAAWWGVILSSLVLIGGQHHFHFRVRQQEDAARWNADRELRGRVEVVFPQEVAKRFPPPPRHLGNYLRDEARRGRPLMRGLVAHGWQVWLSWLVDAGLVLAGAWLGARPLLSRPYCRDCASWYRTTRAGRLGEARLAELSQLVRVAIPAPSGPGHYRQRNCRSGCGPAQLTISWHGAKAAPVAVRPGRSVTWVEAQERRAVGELLDAWQPERSESLADKLPSQRGAP